MCCSYSLAFWEMNTCESLHISVHSFINTGQILKTK